MLAVLGYSWKEKVEVVDIVQPTAIVTAHAVRKVTGRLEDGVVPLVLLSDSGKVMNRVGIIACELVLAWGLVVLCDKFENREREGYDGSERERRNGCSDSDTDRNTFHYANATSRA